MSIRGVENERSRRLTSTQSVRTMIARAIRNDRQGTLADLIASHAHARNPQFCLITLAQVKPFEGGIDIERVDHYGNVIETTRYTGSSRMLLDIEFWRADKAVVTPRPEILQALSRLTSAYGDKIYWDKHEDSIILGDFYPFKIIIRGTNILEADEILSVFESIEVVHEVSNIQERMGRSVDKVIVCICSREAVGHRSFAMAASPLKVELHALSSRKEDLELAFKEMLYLRG